MLVLHVRRIRAPKVVRSLVEDARNVLTRLCILAFAYPVAVIELYLDNAVQIERRKFYTASRNFTIINRDLNIGYG
jgi:hypothetical protein